MAVPRDYTDKPRWKDLRTMLTPIAIGSGISAVMFLVYGIVR
jgi:hypothetical protein